MFKVIYPGSFDPPTNGHLDIMRRASLLFDRIEIVIAVNPRKKYFFSAEERLAMIKEMVNDLSNINVVTWNGLVVDYAEKSGARVILRGVRALSDFDYEFELSMMNRALNSKIETIFLPTDQKYFVLRSSAILELAMFHGDISGMVPPVVEKALIRKCK
ncbi:MAG: pantetheine-phosphate adenylyltransferase [Spirochaetales bacterium]|nr:pantetheine-phosphate adenylyltransferase [Spirochaetales bacterium]